MLAPGRHAGQFATVNGEFVDSSVFLLPTYTATSLILSGRIPGDGNLNGSVGAADYTVWANGFGSSAGFTFGDYNGNGTTDAADYTVWANGFGMANPDFTDGDYNGDGMTDGADYTIWANNFGMMAVAPETSAAAAVPEPSTFMLLFIAAISLIAAPRRSRR